MFDCFWSYSFTFQAFAAELVVLFPAARISKLHALCIISQDDGTSFISSWQFSRAQFAVCSTFVIVGYLKAHVAESPFAAELPAQLTRGFKVSLVGSDVGVNEDYNIGSDTRCWYIPCQLPSNHFPCLTTFNGQPWFDNGSVSHSWINANSS